MKKKSILIVSGGIMQVPAIITAKSMNLNVIVTDKDKNAVGFDYCDEKEVIDSKDVRSHIAFAKKNVERLNICGVFAGSDVAVTVAAIANELGLPSIKNEVAYRSNNKSAMKERWMKDKIPTPVGYEVDNLSEARKILKNIGFPAIVKAVDNAASRGSKKIETFDQLPSALENAIKASKTGTAIIEEYVFGPEQSVETIIFNGKNYHVGVADREFGYHPYHIETSHTDPSQLSNETQKYIYEVVDRAAESLGIDFGPAKADMIYTKKGPMILEMPARLSGGFHSQYTTPLSSGQNPIKAVMQISVGESLDERYLIPNRNNVSVCAGIFPPKGKIVDITGLEEAKKIPGIEHIIITKKIGDFVHNYIDNACRLCWVIAVDENVQKVNDIIRQAKSLIKFQIK